MYNFIKHLHSGFRYAVLLLILTAIIGAFMGRLGNKKYTNGTRKLNLFDMISVHIQVLGGIVLYFLSNITQVAINDWGQAMQNKTLRYWALEHVVMMLLAMALVTVGHIKSKKTNIDALKHRTIAIYYTLALIVVVVAILQSGRPLFGS